MRGKNKCKILKQIRQKIADENDIPYVTRECSYQGECRGTCPKCEAELRYLEQQLSLRAQLGKAVAVAAVAAGLSLGAAGCVPQGGSTQAGATDPSITVPPLDDGTGETEVLEGEMPEWEGETEQGDLTGRILPDEPISIEPNKPEIVLPTETITPVPGSVTPGQDVSSSGDVVPTDVDVSSPGDAG